MEVFSSIFDLLSLIIIIGIGLIGSVLILYGIYSFSEPKFVKSVRHFCLITGGILLVIAYFLYPL